MSRYSIKSAFYPWSLQSIREMGCFTSNPDFEGNLPFQVCLSIKQKMRPLVRKARDKPCMSIVVLRDSSPFHRKRWDKDYFRYLDGFVLVLSFVFCHLFTKCLITVERGCTGLLSEMSLRPLNKIQRWNVMMFVSMFDRESKELPVVFGVLKDRPCWKFLNAVTTCDSQQPFRKSVQILQSIGERIWVFVSSEPSCYFGTSNKTFQPRVCWRCSVPTIRVSEWCRQTLLLRAVQCKI